MAMNTALLKIGADAMAAAATKLAIHTAAPDATGSNLSTAPKVAATWDTTNGVMTATNRSFTGGAASGPATHVGLWSEDEATFYGGYPLTGDQSFNAAGQYTLTSLTITPNAS